MLNALPIPIVQPSDRAKLVSIVDRILSAKKPGSDSDTVQLESALDNIVYGLYVLEKNEIASIESHIRNRTTDRSVEQVVI